MKDLLDDLKERMELAKLIHDRENLPGGHLRHKYENYGKFVAYSHCYSQLKKRNPRIITPEHVEILRDIRDEILLGIENEDSLYIKMQVNKIDSLMFKILTNSESNNSGNENV